MPILPASSQHSNFPPKSREQFFKAFTPRSLAYLRSLKDSKTTIRINFIADSLFPRAPGETLEAFNLRQAPMEELEKTLSSKKNTFSVRLNGKYRALFSWVEKAVPPSSGSSISDPTCLPTPSYRGLKSRCLQVDITPSDKQNN